ncbi:MAG: Na+/H+ antiporter NhaC family protein, partial [Rhodothermales bacterium]|nr:Na+/H+ antiporter NhaC family protein [Rhodothermales bacterium]
YVRGAMVDGDRVSIILFSLMIGGMVGIVTRNGGMKGVVNLVVTWATSRKRGQLVTAILGIAVFFDDYANTLVVGNTMRPVTDRLKISREKLAYIVDSTAAPIACLAFVTTWIGYEVGLIGTAIDQIPEITASPYGIFLNSILYSFYPLFTIAMVFAVSLFGKDYGPMLKAERMALSAGHTVGEGDTSIADSQDPATIPDENKPTRAINAVLPVLVLVFGVLFGLFITGEGDSVREIIGSSDSYKSLMWASLASVLVGAALSIGQRILTVEQTVEAWFGGLKSMLFAMIILVLAWALSDLTAVLNTATYLVSVLGDAIAPGLLPAIVFVLAAATAFATGSSWGTMGILMPLVVPLTWAVLSANGMADASNYHILYSSISCILAGSVWGDHCSPISDTTILSSLASGCDHIEHVRTQLPYAMFAGLTAIIIGTIPTGFGLPWWISLLVGVGLVIMVVRLIGKDPESEVEVGNRTAVSTSGL